MVRKTIYGAFALTAVLAAWSLTAQPAAAQTRSSGPNDLFYNYYVPPTGYAGVGAQLYPSPRPTPPLVGHTYITYQPLMPHEFPLERFDGKREQLAGGLQETRGIRRDEAERQISDFEARWRRKNRLQ